MSRFAELIRQLPLQVCRNKDIFCIYYPRATFATTVILSEFLMASGGNELNFVVLFDRNP